MSSWQKLLWGIAVVAFVLGICGAFFADWWAKDRGCVARTPAGEEVVHSEDLGSKATGWGWQFAIIYVSRDSRG